MTFALNLKTNSTFLNRTLGDIRNSALAMNKVAVVVFVLVGLAVVSARHLPRRDPRVRESLVAEKGALGVYDGTNTTIEAHPYMVSILAVGDFWCAGTILSKSWVLTVASWISYWTMDEYEVSVGSNSSDTGGILYKLSTITLHPDFKDTYNYDYACAKIKGVFVWSNTVKPIKLPTTKNKVNDELEVVGWGSRKYSDYGDDSPVLVQGSMKVVSSSVCNSFFADMYGFPGLSKTMVCVYNKGKTSACLDDQGDPYFRNGVIYGQLSLEAPYLSVCTSSAGPVIMSNIPIVTPWIKNVTGASYEDE